MERACRSPTRLTDASAKSSAMVQTGALLGPLVRLVSPKVELYEHAGDSFSWCLVKIEFFVMVDEERCSSSISCRNERTSSGPGLIHRPESPLRGGTLCFIQNWMGRM